MKKTPPPRNFFQLPFAPQEKWGQNFLFNQNYLAQIINHCPIDPQTIIIEIGSGYGTLTNLLAETASPQIISYEKDEKL